MEPTELTLTVGDTGQITATVEPDDATNQNVTWSSSNEAVATVAGGVVTAVAKGTATITATSNNGKTATVEVTVVEAPDTEAPKLIEVTLTTDEDDNLVLTVVASDNAGLASLEVDHSLEDILPEFTVGTEDVTDEKTGASSTFDEATGTWTLNFGPEVSEKIRKNEEITFYFVITDVNGNRFGSMDPTTPENTKKFDIPDIKVAGNGFKNSSTYKGVFVEISLPGKDNKQIKSFKVELFNENNELIGTNTLKSEKLPISSRALTSPFVVIPKEGGYSSQSWITEWAEGEPSPNNAPIKAVMIAVDENGVSYTAEAEYTGDWDSVWAQDI